MQTKTFKISGMSCKSCAKIIELELKDEKGVGFAVVDFDLAKASLEFDEGKINSEKIKNKIENLGYKVTQE